MDAKLSRWLWLFKWLLIIPHLIVVGLLCIGAAVAVVIAWFTILFTGKYPVSLFDFVVGVVRWSWRVNFYSYGMLSTDKYPPFSMDAGNYPADFTVVKPGELNRVTTLLRLILALPQMVIVYIFSRVIGLLVFVAALVLLFTGTYPQGLYNINMGINRWMMRVTGYLLLLTDKYPPYSVD